MYVTAKQEESKDCRGDKKDSKTVYQKKYGNPYKWHNPYRLNQGLDPKGGIDITIFMTLFWKKQDQQAENGKDRAHLIYDIGLNDRKVAALTIKTCKSKNFKDQPGRLMACKIGIEQCQANYRKKKARNFPPGW